MDARQQLAEVIRTARSESGLKQEVFAREVGVVAAHLSRLENGQGLPSIQLIHKIADRFGADRARMMRLLRQIKGFEESKENGLFDSSPLLERHRRRDTDRAIPVIEDSALLEEWIRANGKPLRALERTAPASAGMTKDRKAFWLEVTAEELTGPGIGPGDLLLVEPSHPAQHGKPSLVMLNDEILLARWLEARDTIVLETVNPTPARLPAIPKDLFHRQGGQAFRIAGIQPCYRSFAPVHDGRDGKDGRDGRGRDE